MNDWWGIGKSGECENRFSEKNEEKKEKGRKGEILEIQGQLYKGQS
jgi:hypothetical protein